MRMIVAVDDRWGIGKNGDLLLSIPDDMRYYRETTRGKAVAMGYNTLLSLPGSKPAPARLNLVLADIPGLRIGGAVVCGSMEQLLTLCSGFAPDDVFVIGGGSIYRQLTPYCTVAHITKMRFDGGADTFITNLDELPEWRVETESELMDYDGLKYSFAVYRNSAPRELPPAPGVSSSMSAYFKKKADLHLRLIDTADPGYKRELGELLTAFFTPLTDGMSADEVGEYLAQGGMSLEAYLRQQKRIAAPEDFDTLAEKYDPKGVLPAKAVTVTKENFREYL